MKPITLLLTLLLTIMVYAQQADRQERKPLTRTDPERAAKAQELLAQARAALSQSGKLDAIQTLSVTGKVRRAAISASASGNGARGMAIINGDVDPTILGANNVKDQFTNGKVEYDFSLPDKFHWQDEVEPFQRTGFLDGERLWQQNNNRAMAVSDPRMAAMMRQSMQMQYAPITLGLLLQPPPGLALEYNYVDKNPFQQTVAEVIAINGPGTFKAELYLDQTTHLPLLLRFIIGGIGHPAMVMMPGGTPRQEGMRALEIAKHQAEAKPPGPQEREKLVLFADYRAVDGVLFPHKITTQINGKLSEEILFTKFKVNQPINPEKFTEKK